jgi:hypothetical protein
MLINPYRAVIIAIWAALSFGVIFLAVKKHQLWRKRILWAVAGIGATTMLLYILFLAWLLIAEWRAGVSV